MDLNTMPDKENNWGWTPERRKKRSETIHQSKPWKKSTGPKTARGKENAKYNALKHGLFTPEGIALRATISTAKNWLD